MTASGKRTIQEPGKNVAQKSGLNRSILDQGWSMFATFLGYKEHERGGVAPYA
jgi:putative transposase